MRSSYKTILRNSTAHGIWKEFIKWKKKFVGIADNVKIVDSKVLTANKTKTCDFFNFFFLYTRNKCSDGSKSILESTLKIDYMGIFEKKRTLDFNSVQVENGMFVKEKHPSKSRNLSITFSSSAIHAHLNSHRDVMVSVASPPNVKFFRFRRKIRRWKWFNEYFVVVVVVVVD